MLHKTHNLLTLVDAKLELADEIVERRQKIVGLNGKLTDYINLQ